MNPRQRQGLLLVLIAAVGLLGVFLLIANYVSSVSRQVGPMTTVLRLVHGIQPYQGVSADDLGEFSLPQKWVQSNALTDPSQALGLVSQVALPPGTELQQGMLTQAPALTPGNEEIAILVNTETGVAGQVQPGDHVDIVANYQASQTTGARNRSEVIVPSALVLKVGTQGSSSVQPVLGTGSGQPMTFSLTPAQVLKVSYAQGFAQSVRLSIVAPGTAPGTAQHTPRPYAPRAP